MEITLNMVVHYLSKAEWGIKCLSPSLQNTSYIGFKYYYPGVKPIKSYLYFSAEFPADEIHESNVTFAIPYNGLVETPALSQSSSIIIFEADERKLFDALQSCFQIYQNWYSSMVTSVLSGKSVHDFFSLSQNVFNNPMIMCSPIFRVIASSYPTNHDDILPEEIIYFINNGQHSQQFSTRIIGDPEFVNKITNSNSAFCYYDPLSDKRMICAAVRNQGHISGFIFIWEHCESLSDGIKDLLDILVQINVISLESPKHYYEPKYRMVGRAILDVFSGQKIDIQIVNSYLKHSGAILGDKHYISIIAPVDSSAYNYLLFRRIDNYLTNRLNHSIIIRDTENIILIINEQELLRSSLKSLLDDLFGAADSRQQRAIVGFSHSFYGTDKLRTYYQQALACLTFASSVFSDSIYFDYSQVVMYDFISHLNPDFDLQSILHPALEILLEYDRKKNTELFSTLCVLTRLFFNTKQVAKELHLHKNTLYYRINQFKDIAGINIEDEFQREHLRISVCIYDYLIKAGKDKGEKSSSD